MGILDPNNVSVVDKGQGAPPPSPSSSASTAVDAASSSRPAPPGILHSAYRGFSATMQGLDQLIANTMGIVDKIPGVTPGTLGADAQKEADRRSLELANDPNKPQTTGEKLTEKVVSGIGRTIPYLAAKGPLGAATVGGLENAHGGPVDALSGAARAALYHTVGSKLGEATGKITQSIPIPAVAQKAAAGAATAAILSPPGETGSQAIVGALAGAMQPKSKSANEERAAKLMAATGRTARDAWTSYKVVGPALEETAAQAGEKPKTVPELRKNVQDTLARTENEFQSYISPIRDQLVDATPVADAIRNSIKRAERDGVTKDADAVASQLEKRAREFEKPITLESLNDLRQIYFENLRGTSSEKLQERSSADIRADRIAEQAIKDLVYPIVDQEAVAQGKPPGYVRGTLKTQQAHLIQLSDALLKRTDALNEKEGIRQGTPITQRSNVTLAGHPSGGVVGSIHGLMRTLFGDPDSYQEANKRVAEGFNAKGKNPPNLIGSAVAGARPAAPFVGPPAVDLSAPQSSAIVAPQVAATAKMKAPNGQVSDVPLSQVEHYKSKGAVVIQ